MLLGVMDQGYSFQIKVLNASDYGVPQNRRRVFIVGSRTGILPSWPEATHSDPDEKLTANDAIGDLQFTNHGDCKTVSKYRSGLTEEGSYASRMRGELKRTDKRTIYNHNYGETGEPSPGSNLRILDWDSPARTIMATKRSRDSCLHPGTCPLSPWGLTPGRNGAISNCPRSLSLHGNHR